MKKNETKNELVELKNSKPYDALNYDDYEKEKQVFSNNKKTSLSFSKLHSEDYLKMKTLKLLKERFDLESEDLKEKFDEAVSGDGKEIYRICTLISSSLCAFLHFYNVSESHPLIIDFNEKEVKRVVFTDVYFEVQNDVIENPSNVDVVLISDDQKTILFLESKFSEYLELSNDKKNISSKYEDEYGNFGLFEKYYGFEKNKGILRGKKEGKCDNRKAYFEGVKQMISHYIGVENFIDGGYWSKDRKKITPDKLKPDCKVLLGEILFNAWPEEYKNYESEYENIYKVLNSRNSPKENLIVLKKLLTYQELFRDNENNYKNLNEKIRKFYKYDE